MIRRRALVVVSAAIALACGALDDAPTPSTAVNRCPQFACGSYAEQRPVPTCVAGVCAVSQQLDYTLVVSMPETSIFAPTHIFALRSSDFFLRATPTCGPVACVVFPALLAVQGAYVVNRAAEDGAGVRLGNPGETALPASARWRPLWGVPRDRGAVDATLAGLPLAEILSVPRDAVYPGAPPGPVAGPSFQYRVVLPTGEYERTLSPLAPFDEMFPPDIRALPSDEPFDILRLVSTANAIETFRFPVAREDGSLEGFTAELVDEATGQRVSTIARLRAGDTTAVLSVVRRAAGDARLLDLLLVPPAAQRDQLPTLTYVFTAGTTPPITYPRLPAAVTVRGAVGGKATIDATPVPVRASIDLETTEVDTFAGPMKDLRLVRRIQTDDGGRYAARLPPGVYKAVVTPFDPAHAEGGADVVPFAQNAEASVRVARTPSVQFGRDLAVTPPARVRGKCVLADGRPLEGARVVARPAAALASGFGGPAGAPVSASEWPRPTAATTRADGAFELALDIGTYDVTVKPPRGSRFPWVVAATSRYVGSQSADLGNVAVPAPVVVALALRDPADNPIARAIVRAYAVPTSGTVAVQIGEAITDIKGRFEMDLAGYPK